VGFAASVLNSEGIQLEKSGDIRAALAKYRAALDLDPTGFGFRLNYALALCRLGRWQDGIVELREVLRLDQTMQTRLRLCISHLTRQSHSLEMFASVLEFFGHPARRSTRGGTDIDSRYEFISRSTTDCLGSLSRSQI